VRRLASHLADELNVKALEVVTDEGALVSYRVRPVLPLLGPKYGQMVPRIRAALEALPAAAVAAAVHAGEAVELVIDGAPVTLAPGEIEVMAAAREGLATSEADGLVVGIVTELTSELVAEGVARDVVRHVNQLRKDAGLEITDRVTLSVAAPADIAAAVDAWRAFVAGETLAVAIEMEVQEGAPATAEAAVAAGRTIVDIDGRPVTLSVAKEGA
jgi:isoleucyl-tRNA synthetase